jgi:hypothetical protein
VEDANFEWLSLQTRERAGDREFHFYFACGEPMDEELCDKILMQVGMQGAEPVMQLIHPAQ